MLIKIFFITLYIQYLSKVWKHYNVLMFLKEVPMYTKGCIYFIEILIQIKQFSI